MASISFQESEPEQSLGNRTNVPWSGVVIGSRGVLSIGSLNELKDRVPGLILELIERDAGQSFSHLQYDWIRNESETGVLVVFSFDDVHD